MTRRRLVVLVSAAVMLSLGIAAITLFVIATRSDYGRERILREFIEPIIASRINGKVFIGRLGGNLLDSVTIDSVEVRGPDGEVFARTGRIMAKFDARDLWDERVYLRRLTVEHPYLHFVQRPTGSWNFNEVFKSGGPEPKGPRPQGGWGSFFTIDSTSIRDGKYVLTLPWHVDDNLRGAARDSAIRYNLAREDHSIDRAGTGFIRTYIWQNISGSIARARLADPDSNATGREIHIASLNVDESDPPFDFRRIRGLVRIQGDSVWFDAQHFDLPASTGVASGKIVWGHNLPIRYDIAVRGDSVSLNDVNWVYPTLPRTGGGSTLLHIQNEPKNLSVLNFKLTKMDVRSTKSHLTGAMSFGTGQPLLLVRDVDLKADPVDFDLLRTLAGKPFPVDWQGRLVGTVKARGGVLTNFYVDDARGVFYDAHVAGATTNFAGHGELDILQPAFTAFHGFEATVSPLDLRTIRFLYPAFPPLGGVVSGTATLDSSWLDVRFSNARIEHQDGPGEPSRFSGSGRVTYGVPFMSYDVALQAAPLSLTMMARSYPMLSFRGLVSGPIRAKGTSADLELTTALRGVSGALSFDGRVDVDSIGGYGAHGRGDFAGINVRQLLERSSIPAGTFAGRYDVDLAGATLADLRGKADLELERSTFAGVRLFPSRALVRFADGRMLLDSVHVRTDLGAATIARGALGLRKGVADSLVAEIIVDSLGGLRRLARGDSAVAGADSDSLSGSFSGKLTVSGRVDSLDVHGRLDGTDVFLRGIGGQPSLEFQLRNALAATSGAFRLSATKVALGGIALDTVGATLDVASRSRATFSAVAARANGPQFTASGQLVDSANFRSILLQSLALNVGSGHWLLSSPARLDADSAGGLRLGSLTLRSGDSSVIAMSGDIPATGPVTAQLQASTIPLSDFGFGAYSGLLKQLTDLSVRVSGTKAHPVIAASGNLVAGDSGGAFERATATANYANARLNGQLALLRRGQAALTASGSIPMDVTLFSARMPNDSLTFRIDADSADLGIVQAFAPKSIDKASGRLTAHVDAAGRWRSSGSIASSILNLAPRGDIRVVNGRMDVRPMGVTLLDLKAHATLDGNKLVIEDLSASTRADKKSGWVRVTGSIANLADAVHPDSMKLGYDLKLLASDFHAIDRRTLAKLDVTTSDGLRLTGPTGAVTLNGALTVERGQVFLPDPEIARKRFAEIAFDTATSGAGSGMDAALSRLGLRSMQVTVVLGQDVKLKSTAADVKLTGSVVVSAQRASGRGPRGELYPLTVNGVLQANSGTYTLDFGAAVKRDFTVTRGLVTFDNSKNPDVDISAIYRVKRQGKEDIGVIVNVKGPLIPAPRIEFASDQSYTISQSDLLSYLITNEAGFDFTSSAAPTQVWSFLTPTLSSYASAGLRDKLGLGSVFDQVQFQGAAVTGTEAATRTDVLNSFWNGATLNGQKQVGENAFFSLNAGLCAFTGQKTTGQPTLAPLDAFAGSFEYRFPAVTLQASVESSTQARYCNAAGSLTSLAPTPRQLSLVLRKSWRF